MNKPTTWLAHQTIVDSYSKAVTNAYENEDDFSNFKQQSNYNGIVGMSQEWQAAIWYDHIKDSYPDILQRLSVFAENDTIGSPSLWTSPEGLSISPNTLRYINTCIEIHDYFKFKKLPVVSELGVGYGGLCFILNKFFNIDKYILLDLPNVQQLSQKYLSRLGTNNTSTEFTNSDLFISEFCLSEFSDEGLYDFYERYVKKSKHIYLHMNLHEEDRKSKFLEVLSKDFLFDITDEFPKTGWPNYVIRGTIKI